jgi:hypothetical protein
MKLFCDKMSFLKLGVLAVHAINLLAIHYTNRQREHHKEHIGKLREALDDYDKDHRYIYGVSEYVSANFGYIDELMRWRILKYYHRIGIRLTEIRNLYILAHPSKRDTIFKRATITRSSPHEEELKFIQRDDNHAFVYRLLQNDERFRSWTSYLHIVRILGVTETLRALRATYEERSALLIKADEQWTYDYIDIDYLYEYDREHKAHWYVCYFSLGLGLTDVSTLGQLIPALL